MENVKFEVVDDNRLVIHVDLNHRGDISASGKTRRVASTQGNIGVKDANGVEVKIGLNVYVKWGIHLTQVTTTYCGWPLAAPGKACR